MHSVSLQMVAVIGLSVLFNVPRYLDDHVVRRPDGSLVLERTYLGNNATFQLVYAGLLYYIVIYALPVVILTAMTYRQLLVRTRSRLLEHRSKIVTRKLKYRRVATIQTCRAKYTLLCITPQIIHMFDLFPRKIHVLKTHTTDVTPCAIRKVT